MGVPQRNVPVGVTWGAAHPAPRFTWSDHLPSSKVLSADVPEWREWGFQLTLTEFIRDNIKMNF